MEWSKMWILQSYGMSHNAFITTLRCCCAAFDVRCVAFNNYAITVDHMFMFSIYGFFSRSPPSSCACLLQSITYIFLLVMCSSSSSVFIAIGWLTLSKAYLRLGSYFFPYFFSASLAFIAFLHNTSRRAWCWSIDEFQNQFCWLRRNTQIISPLYMCIVFMHDLSA